jgi:DNA polymerase III sliding clamp (beta) subunit (PCNA family)
MIKTANLLKRLFEQASFAMSILLKTEVICNELYIEKRIAEA